MEGNNPTADAIELLLMEYCATGVSKKYRTGQQSKLKIKRVKIYHDKLYRGVVSWKTKENKKQLLDKVEQKIVIYQWRVDHVPKPKLDK